MAPCGSPMTWASWEPTVHCRLGGSIAIGVSDHRSDPDQAFLDAIALGLGVRYQFMVRVRSERAGYFAQAV
jgi:hypothetical protein